MKMKKYTERMFAVAVRDVDDLFLWIRIRRAATGLYYMFPTGRKDPEWKKWDPHGSLHEDGRLHHKSYDRKFFSKQTQKPDSNFKGSMNWVTRPISSDEPRAFGEICDPAKFAEIMEIPISIVSAKKYDTQVSIDLTDSHGSPSINTSDGKILAKRIFKDEIPWILVSVISKPPPTDEGWEPRG
jgi:hypothetical protein